MSKMPAKKKSCFQITSVTQAQVAASSATDDTESLDDPDETRTEDVSSEIYDVSRTHFEHELCNRTFSEEISNNVGEYETGQTPLARPPPTDSVKVVPSFRNVITNSVTNTSHLSPTTSVSAAQMSATAVTGISQHPVIHQSTGTANLSFNSSQIASTTSSGLSATTTTTSCSSRFRVIKLDHGIGEPFRRGRWTCTEFYEKDPEGTVISRNVDAIGLRHNSTLELGTDRDSGLGTTGGSTAAPSGLSGHGPDAGTEVATPAVPHANHLDLQQQAYSAGQQQHHPVSSSLTHEAYSNSNNSKPMTSQQQTQAASHPPLPQNLIPGLNDPQHTMYMPKSPGVPSGLQQPLLYQNQVAQQQPPGSAHPGSIGHQLMSSQTSLPQAGAQCAGYSEQHPLVTTTQMNSRVNLSMGQAVNLAPVPTPAKPVQGLGTSCEVVGDLPGAPTTSTSMPASVSTHLQQQPVTTNGMGNASASVLLVASAQLTPMNQYPTSGGSSSHLPPSAPSSNAQNVPPVSSMAGSLSTPASSTIVPLASNTGPPSIRLSALQQQQQPQPLPPQQPLGVCSSTAGVSGVPSHPTASTRGLADESQRKTDVISHFPIVSGKDHPPKALIPESLKLAHPTVNSLFGIPIHIDGDEDRNPSTAFYQAFQPGGKLRSGKAPSNSASGASFVAIDNKIEQAMDLVKSHLMYAVREEVEVLKEQIKELYERNSVLERENAVLKSLANSDQLSQLSVQSSKVTATSSLGQLSGAQALGTKSTSTSQAALLEMGRSIATPPLQPNVTSA